MRGYAMLRIGESGWIDKERPECGPLDAIVKPLAIAICTSDIHTLWEGAIGDRHNMILGHEACGEVVEVGELVKDFKPGDRVLVPAITPDWSSLEAQAGYSMPSGRCARLPSASLTWNTSPNTPSLKLENFQPASMPPECME